MASWLSSRLKAAEQFLNQIDATAADRAQKAKERAQQGLGSDTETGELSYDNRFPRTASELSFTDETPTGGHTYNQSGDEGSDALPPPRLNSVSRPPISRERIPTKKEAPPAADWTELLKGDKNALSTGPKLARTSSSVNAVPSRAPRAPKQGAPAPAVLGPPQATVAANADVRVPVAKLGGMDVRAESSIGSAVGKLMSANEDEAVSRQSDEQRPSDDGGIAMGEGVIGPVTEAKGLEVVGKSDSENRPLEGPETPRTVPAGQSSEPAVGVNVNPSADSSGKPPEYLKKGMVRNDSGLEKVIPTSDSEEESTVGGGSEGRRSSGSGNEKGDAAGGQTEGQAGTVSGSVAEAPGTVESDQSGLGLEGSAAVASVESPEEAIPYTGEPREEEGVNAIVELTAVPPMTGVSKPPAVPSREDPPNTSKTESRIEGEKTSSHRRNFSMREYLGQDLSVKDIETEGVDSDAESESGTDEETDSDSDDSEDERVAELQRQKEEAERQEIERQKAAAAAAALEVTAAETAARAVKEREDVVALLEKEKEELQLEAAEASERHAKEIARLRATATAGSRAAHVEKSSHSSTRMETFSKEEQLVMENIEKAKALAAAQRALEDVVTKALEARRRVEERELHRAELQKQLAEAQQQLRRLREDPEPAAATSAQAESALAAERERVEADITRKRQRVAELEARLAAAAGQKREPSEQEKELERRLQSLTDHLIQKQAQVEALASEKATLALRLETVSASLHEDEKGDGPFRKRGKHGRQSGTEWWLEDDLEYGSAENNERAGRSGRPSSPDSDASDDDRYKKHRGGILPGPLVTVLQRFDSLALGGGRFLRFNTPARVLLGLYVLLLHAWVLLVWSVQSVAVGAGSSGLNQAVGGAASKEVSDVWLPRGH